MEFAENITESKSLTKKHKMIREIAVLCVLFIIPLIVYRYIPERNVIWGSDDNFAWLSNSKYWQQMGFSFWKKNYAAGVPVLNMYPVSVLLSWLPESYFVYIFYCLHIGAGAFFMYKYLKEVKCSADVSFITALIYEFSVHLSGVRRCHMVIIIVIVYMPIVFYLIQKYFNTQKLYWLIISSFALAAVTFGGLAQDVLYLDIAAFLYLVIVGFRNSGIKKTVCHGMAWGLSYIALISMWLTSYVGIMREYSAMGSAAPGYDTFASFSVHPIKLFGMFFSDIFDHQIMSFGTQNSSDIDFDLIIGSVLMLFVIFGAIRFKKDFYIRLCCVLSAVFMIYSVSPHIPYIGGLVYRIPMIGGFRCATRAIFIFIFFMYAICAKVLTEIKDEEHSIQLRAFLKKTMGVFFILVSAVSLVILTIVYVYPNIMDFDVITGRIRNIFFKPFVLLLSVIAALEFFEYLRSFKKLKWMRKINFTAIMLAAATMLEVLPYSLTEGTVSLDHFAKDNAAFEQIAANDGNGKVWEAYPMDYYSDFSLNYKAIEKNIQFINYYAAFNNPSLVKFFKQSNDPIPYNSSGLLRGSSIANYNLRYQNNFLSMMGVKYIVDNNELIDESGSSAALTDETSEILSIDSAFMAGVDSGVTLISLPLALEDDCLYEVSFRSDSDSSAPIQIDFYGGASYDSNAQERSVNGLESGKEYVLKIDSGKASSAESDTLLRFFSYNIRTGEDVVLSDISVRKRYTDITPNVYVPFYIDENNRVYENTLANDILSVPRAVSQIEDENYIYDNMLALDLANISFIKDKNSFDTAPAVIDNIDFGNDRITADVAAEGTTFVNFAECYFTGWRAYIDGKRTQLYKVNNVIMGIEVPGGAHRIEFRYVPVNIIIGLILLISTTVFWIVFFAVSHKRSAAKSSRKA